MPRCDAPSRRTIGGRSDRLICLFAFLLQATGIQPSIASPTPPDTPMSHRIFVQSRFSMDKLLTRPYDSEVPFGSSGNRIWATSPQGWGFREGVQILYVTNRNVFDPRIRSNGVRYVVQRADYYPSHIHMVGGPRTGLSATASFTYKTDRVENPLTKPFKPEKRWTCWSSQSRTDWYAVDFGRPHQLIGFHLYFYDDQPNGGCAPPETFSLTVFRKGRWVDESAKIQITDPLRAGSNTIELEKPVEAEQIKLTFRNRGSDRYTGLYGFDPHYATNDFPAPAKRPVALRVTGDKWITQDDVLVSQLTVENLSKTSQPVSITMNATEGALLEGTDGIAEGQTVDGQFFGLYLLGISETDMGRDFSVRLKPKQRYTVRYYCAVGIDDDEIFKRLKHYLSLRTPLEDQIAAYQGWFDKNIAAFRCSDPLVTKMYYHRWYNLRKNSMYPRIGALKYRAFAEGRWTSDWYANIISYGAAHQIREACWLRDPSYCWGPIQTWTDNPRPDGIFPARVGFKGSLGGQYTDWITSSVWEAYKIHPSKGLLGSIADTLDRNTEGWREVYGWGNSPLLVVDSHWWTGMEWQPSFFAFADYQTGGGSGEDRRYMTPLRRVDLTAYNFGNAQAVANIYRELGRREDAERLQKLADETRNAVQAKMWDSMSHWFLSLRASDDTKTPTKEIIGLYPFYFNLPRTGKGYEKAWDIALDPGQFWTTWPLASVCKDCPAFAQNGWPVGPGGSICMWNGPSWPHANSIILTAMANTLRSYPGVETTRLTRQKLFDLFNSFTRVQYRDQNPRYPWTGEFYNGDTGAWKTTQRDYNHSTWIDPLIRDLIGLIPRNDDILEIDPLIPANAWSYWILDGQAYRKHDVTIAYDAQGGHVAPGFKGFAVYIDGKRVFRADRPTHFQYDMKASKLLTKSFRNEGRVRSSRREGSSFAKR